MNNSILSLLSMDNASLLEDIFEQYKKSPDSVDQKWVTFFKSFEESSAAQQNISFHNIITQNITLQDMGIQGLLNTYRAHGHVAATIDPLNQIEVDRTQIDKMLNVFTSQGLELEYDTHVPNIGTKKLKDIIEKYESIYCNTIGYEHYYLLNETERLWLQEKIESNEHNQPLAKEKKLRVFDQLVRANYFEKFLAKKFIGKKRFSLEGGESFIPMLDAFIDIAADNGMESITIGMAHRGRLNVLVNTLQKPATLIFAEFEEKYNKSNEAEYSADVKYHLGYSNYIKTPSGKTIKVSLPFNPSHLEAVNPVVLGAVRARQKTEGDVLRDKSMGILVHGDAAFMGQGVVAETLNLSNLTGFTTGGCLHIIVNNQIGFTTFPNESRSTPYATGLAKGFQLPVFHVNGDDPEAVVRIMKLAFEYRAKFKKDIIVDLICYRKLGHNETDEPSFTQPVMYDIIANHKSTLALYEEKLLQDSSISTDEIENIKLLASNWLEEMFKKTTEEDIHLVADTVKDRWSHYSRKNVGEEPDTKLSKQDAEPVIKALINIPSNFNLHNKLIKVVENREKMYNNEMGLDWGAAEALSIGSLLQKGHNVRFVGQDSIRGTFSHRHIGWIDTKTNERWFPLHHISQEQEELEVINSPLSEFSVLGYEYGYSLAAPDSLVLWEAQFGDFVNGAQVIIDQFISSSEVKWLKLSGITLLLPHGYEGQGPEHSSARLERFLNLCASYNMEVCYPSTPAQYFHLLRRQVLRKFRKPLVVMTPKSLLRNPVAVSSIDTVLNGLFQEYIADDKASLKEINTLVLVTGKIYYEVLESRNTQNKTNIAIGRVEKLYPFPSEALIENIKQYPNLKKVIWLQEEPENMGAWLFVQEYLRKILDSKLILEHVSRNLSPSPAGGFSKRHIIEQENLIKKALS